MSSISEIRRVNGRPPRWEISIDGEVVTTLTRGQVEAGGFYTGQELGETEFEARLHLVMLESAHAAALRFVSYRPRSSRELRNHLHQRGFSEPVIQEITERLENAQLSGDRMFSQFWTDNRSQFGPRGRLALQQELRHKGVDRTVIDETLTDLPPEIELAYSAACRKARAWTALEDEALVAKLTDFLRRRGFAFDVSRQTAERIRQEREDLETSDG